MKGRVQAHDEFSRVAVRVDGNEVLMVDREFIIIRFQRILDNSH